MCPLIKIKQGVPLKMDAGDNSTFEEWLIRIDAILLHARGLSYKDLPDGNLRDWYEARLRPIRAANKLLKLAIE